MSDRAIVWRTTDHRATARSGFCSMGLLSYLVTVSRATIPWANVRQGCCTSGYYFLSGLCPRVTVRWASVYLATVRKYVKLETEKKVGK